MLSVPELKPLNVGPESLLYRCTPGQVKDLSYGSDGSSIFSQAVLVCGSDSGIPAKKQKKSPLQWTFCLTSKLP